MWLGGRITGGVGHPGHLNRVPKAPAKAILAFRSGDGNLPRQSRQDCHPAGDVPFIGGTRGPRLTKRLVVVTQGHRGRPATGSRRRTPTKLQIYEYVRPTGVPVQSPSRSIRAAKIAPPPRTRTRMLTLARMFARFCFHVSLFCPTCATGLLLC